MYDKEGFLYELSDWNASIAETIASGENITLTDKHWEIIDAAQAYFKQFDISPEMRPLIKWIKQTVNADKASSIYLLTLFPNSPAKLVSKIAGLPKPNNCI